MSRQSRQGRMNAHYWRNEVQKAYKQFKNDMDLLKVGEDDD